MVRVKLDGLARGGRGGFNDRGGRGGIWFCNSLGRGGRGGFNDRGRGGRGGRGGFNDRGGRGGGNLSIKLKGRGGFRGGFNAAPAGKKMTFSD